MMNHINFYNYKQWANDQENKQSTWLRMQLMELDKRDVCEVLKDLETLRDMYKLKLKEETARYMDYVRLVEEGKA